MTLTAVELVMVQHAVRDYAGRWFGQVGAVTYGRADAARYVAEAHLSKLCARHTLKVVWRAVAEAIAQDESVLRVRLSDAQIAERVAARRAEAEALGRQAAEAFQAGDLASTLALIDRAELAAPLAEDWDDLRRFARERIGGL